MIIKTPKFWFKNKNEINSLFFTLKPLSKIWEFATQFRLSNGMWEKMPIPVICVGNITVGGSGKTPVTMALQLLLKDMGIKACVISRGYGGKIKYPHYVNKNDTFDKVGDEPIILSKKGEVIVSKIKRDGIIKAFKDGFDIVLLDDGYQNSKINKDLSLVVVDSEILFGNEMIFPLGPLREPIKSGLSRADAIIFVGNKCKINTSKIEKLNREYQVKVVEGFINEKTILKKNQNKKVLAFCGIAFPNKFFKSLKNIGYEVIKTKVFPDHYHYNLKDIIKLKNCAKNYELKLITTEKDIVRIPKKFHSFIDKVEIEFQFRDLSKIKKMIKNLIDK